MPTIFASTAVGVHFALLPEIACVTLLHVNSALTVPLLRTQWRLHSVDWSKMHVEREQMHEVLQNMHIIALIGIVSNMANGMP